MDSMATLGFGLALGLAIAWWGMRSANREQRKNDLGFARIIRRAVLDINQKPARAQGSLLAVADALEFPGKRKGLEG